MHWINDWQLSAALALLGMLPAGFTLAQTCPEEPNRVTAQVDANVEYDAPSRLYTYNYTVSSEPASIQEIDRFAIETVEPVLNIEDPPGWFSKDNFSGRPVISWDAMEVADPDRIDDDALVPPSIVQIKPGTTLGGFSFQSPKPPGQVRYFLTGYVPLAGATADDEADAELAAETLVETCPHLQLAILDQALVGSTLGPVDATADLVLTIDGPVTLPRVAPYANYVLTLANHGSSAAVQPTLTIDGNTFTTAARIVAPADWNCIKQSNGSGSDSVTIVCNGANNLAAGASVDFGLRVNAIPRPAGRTITVQGTASSPTPDVNPADNSASFSTRVQ